MQLFYTPQVIQGQNVLDETESKHCVRVLRMKEGDTIQLIDGAGGWYTAQITHAHSKACTFEITGKEHLDKERPYSLTVAIAPPKNIDRFEWFLEKATEIGIDEIVPLRCDHSERKVIKPERSEKIIIAAMKQSFKAHKPLLHALTPFDEYVKKAEGSIRCIAHCRDGDKNEFKNLVQPEKIVILIGPEGDFSDAEIALVKQEGFAEVQLGSSRLRTETAGIMACMVPSVML